ncbi:MAG: RNA polymerase sigma factor [Planctomycetaceae bacterium]|nr:RNA polymerase sigma factor [Planctomycetaceae bacterium]
MTTTNEVRIDPAVVAAMYLEHGEELRAFLLGVLKDHDLANEALQATFIKAMEQGHTARQETRKGWLFRVAFHEALAIKRRGKSYEKNLRKMAWSRSTSEEHAPDDQLCRWETVVRVRQALEKLPENQRQIVHLRIYEEKTFAEIAEQLRLPLGTVLTRMRLALKRLETLFPTKND